VDWEFRNTSWDGNPYDVAATATFVHEDGKSKHTTELFHAGNNTWKLRFTGTRTGDWKFRTDSDDPDLDDLAGKVTVSPNRNPNARGFLTHVGNQYAMQVGNDAHLEAYPFTVFMDRTKYMALDFQDWSEDTIRAYCDHAKGNGCEVLFVHVNNQWFKSGVREWNKHNSENPDLETFERLEQIVITAYREGCRVHFWAWGDESRKWTPRGVPGGVNGRTDRRLQRYIAARLGPLPGWTMGYGFDLHEWTSEEQLNSWAEFLHEHFGWQHLLAARGVPLRGRNNIRSYDGFGRSVSVATTAHGPQDYREIVDDLAEDLDHPHLYEERHSYLRKGFDLDMDGTRRLLWRETMAGGMGGFFGFYPRSSSAFAGHPYPNPKQLQAHHTFWHKHKRLRLGMVPAAGLVQGGYALKDRSNTRFLVYSENAAEIQMDLSDATTALEAVAVDTKQEYSEIPLGRLAAQTQTWKAPYTSDWAIAIGP
jgi:hypothetical protein